MNWLAPFNSGARVTQSAYALPTTTRPWLETSSFNADTFGVLPRAARLILKFSQSMNNATSSLNAWLPLAC